MVAENSVICLLGVMDRLWFHQIILFAEPSLFPIPKTPETLLPTPRNNSETSLSIDQESLVISETAVPKDEISSPESESETMSKQRQTRLWNVMDSTKPRSSSTSAEKYWKNLSCLGSIRRLQKTVSCKSLEELELEEAKGFMDLGFVFEKERVSKRMMSLIPALQRLEKQKYEEKDVYDDHEHDDENENDNEDDESRGIMRPYLSESWLIRRPDSPLLNLRVPRTSTAADMKKYLKYWARTVASSIQQEC
ncbi:unnamed protein product [Fraxinus pennsylvanica]|uniref:Uncharacterized protein n=1 Tax=Fraxinus pennsylvanica TaxID=56036 RepID=A0AAD2E8I2_9LAMI|nr:unnamed protein product [Fraxinus pennsylvanica]